MRFRPLLAALGLLALLPLPAVAATTVVLRDGTSLTADMATPTATGLLLVTPDNRLRQVKAEAIARVDGMPYADYARMVASAPTLPAPLRGVVPSPTPSVAVPLLPLAQGTFRRFSQTQTLKSWRRDGQKLTPLPTVQTTGFVRDTVLAAPVPGVAPAAVRQTIVERAPKQPAREIHHLFMIEPREDGYYLVSQTLQDSLLKTPLASRMARPPMLWPAHLKVGESWVVGPYFRTGAYEVTRLEVVGRETVAVPAGRFVEAYRVASEGYVFGGHHPGKAGLITTDYGQLTSTLWIVPGIGPVKEVVKARLSGSFTPNGPKAVEQPLVVEETYTRLLTEYGQGKL